MSKCKPKLFITPEVIRIRLVTEEFINSLREKFDVRTADKSTVTRSEFLSLCRDQDAILALGSSDQIDAEVVEAAGGSLKIVSIVSAGYDTLNTSAMKANGIRVGLAGGALSNPTSELAVALLLAASRRLVFAANRYISDPIKCFSENRGLTAGLEDSTIGIIGAGRIGQSVAKKVKQFEIGRLLYYSRSKKDEMEKLDGQLCSLEDVARDSDYVIVTLEYNAQTDKIISRKLLNLMKPNAIIVNVGRGGLIDQDALVEVLQNKKIGGAALDVTTPEPLPPGHPLLHLENALILPHLGGVTASAGRKAMDIAVRNLTAFFNGERMPEELVL